MHTMRMFDIKVVNIETNAMIFNLVKAGGDTA